jgi:hypothetical protein
MLSTAPRYYDSQQRLKALAVRAARRNKRNADREVVAHQLAAATLAVEAGDRMLEEQGIDAAGETVNPRGFTSGEAAGAMLATTETDYNFDLLVATLVNDAARTTLGAFIATRRESIGHVRYLSPPSCQRCAVLAGRWYRWSSGFDRHPGCDCQMIPTSAVASPDLVYDPQEAFENGQIKDLNKAQTKAIQDGADISQVVNSKRGMSQSTTIKGTRFDFTLEGTTVRGNYGKTGPAARAMEKNPGERYLRTTKSRLTPETIYRVASDRAHATRLLKHYGYIL